MMNGITKVAMLSVVCLVCSGAMGASYSLVPPDRDLGDLDHYRYYTWGLDTPWSVIPDVDNNYEQAIGASLSFKSIRNWNNQPNVLYIHLLDNAPLGIRTGYDGQGGGDNFAGQGIVLTVYQNLPSTAQNLSYSFSGDEIEALNDYAADGRFALGFDPDCHFYNCGVKLDIDTAAQVVPEPATMTLLLVGGGLVALRKRRKQK
ncbi:MAG: PEP-CTERM sorting domain-containing protein [Phycisphaerae bacterium]|nr:PEP-CTERM sorting domain-containing protein [Phycisphaerae bacterium]